MYWVVEGVKKVYGARSLHLRDAKAKITEKIRGGVLRTKQVAGYFLTKNVLKMHSNVDESAAIGSLGEVER